MSLTLHWVLRLSLLFGVLGHFSSPLNKFDLFFKLLLLLFSFLNNRCFIIFSIYQCPLLIIIIILGSISAFYKPVPLLIIIIISLGIPRIDKLEIEGRGFHTNLYAVRGIYSGGKEGKSRIQWLRSMVGSPDLISIPGMLTNILIVLYPQKFDSSLINLHDHVC